MSSKLGRPRAENPKDTRIQIRLDKATLDKLDECAEIEMTTRSSIIRQGINLVHAKIKK